ncbi:MAG: hypothetical protein ABR992_15865 [Solirubrobacteraceae bacterium]|jgi:hypothetical protein
MARKTTLILALFILTALASTASASSGGPKSLGYYASTQPRLSVYVDKGAKTVELYISCPTSTTVSEYWDSPKLKLKDDKFSFDGKTSISTENGATFSHLSGSILFNGKFSGGAFHGTAQIVGSSCPKSSYTAKYDKNGAGSGA